MAEESTTPDVVELVRRCRSSAARREERNAQVNLWARGVATRRTSHAHVDEARAAAERHAKKRA
jgi:hypothetical protein